MANVSERFWAKVDKGPECWLWRAGVSVGGYGSFHVSGGSTKATNRVRVYAHRWAYEERFGQIPDGFELDHLCRVRACVNPDHLQPVTHGENHRRRVGIKTGPYDVGETCKRGHPRTPENTGINTDGYRYCRPCARVVTARCYAAKKRNDM